MNRKNCHPKSSIWMFVFTGVLILLSIPAYAETSCRPIPNPYYPGLKRCVASVDLETAEATPDEPQKLPLWCWAASLSMIYTKLGHPISQESIVIQNFGSLVNAPGGPFLTFQARLNREYKDDNGHTFKSVATRINTPQEAADALDNDEFILYTTSQHATVQTSLTYEVAPNGPVVFKGGKIWDPGPGVAWTQLSGNYVTSFRAAWSITIEE